MIKRLLLPLTLIIVFLIPNTAFAEVISTPEPPDFRNGLLDDDYIIKTNTLHERAYDNDLETRFVSTLDSPFEVGYIEFRAPVNLNGYFIQTGREHTSELRMYFSDGTQTEETLNKNRQSGYFTLDYQDVIKIDLVKYGTNSISIYEIDFFGSYDFDGSIVLPENVTNVITETTHDSITLSYDLPPEFDFIKIEIDGNTYETTNNTFTIENLEPDHSYDITIKTVLNDFVSSGVLINAQTDIKRPERIKNLDYTTTDTSITLNYDLPPEFDFIEIEIDGNTYETTNESYTIDNLQSDTNYEIKILTVLNGVKSDVITINVKTNIPIPEKPEDVPNVKNLTIEVEPERVDLYWENPAQYFGKAVIYRKDLTTSTSLINLLVPSAKASTDDYVPIFETNGTHFADLTVQPENDYEYKVTNIFNGLESTGITVQTGSIPKPPIIDLDGLEIPFKTNDLLDVIMWLVSLVTGFILLSLAIRFAPRMINVVKNAIGGR